MRWGGGPSVNLNNNLDPSHQININSTRTETTRKALSTFSQHPVDLSGALSVLIPVFSLRPGAEFTLSA